jgi:hypothetical protein
LSIRGFTHGMVAAATAVAVAGCAGEDPATSEDAAKSSALASAGVYAYLTVEFGESWQDTESQMFVMNGTEEIGRSDPLLLAERPQFTADGRYAFTLPAFLDEIIVIAVDSGRTTSVPCEGCGDRQTDCHCQIVAPIGGSQIAWLAGPDNHLVRVDLAARTPTPQPTAITLPTEDGFLDEKRLPNLIAGTDGAALASYPGVLPGDDLLPAYLVTLDNPPRRLDPGRPDSTDEATFSPDATRVALTGNQENACATVTVVDVASGTGETAPVSAEPGTTCANHDVYIESLWWDQDGSLNLTFEPDDQNTTVKAGQRQLEGGRWVETHTGPASEVRQLSAGTATIQGDAPGTLHIEADGERAEVDTDVRYLTTAP